MLKRKPNSKSGQQSQPGQSALGLQRRTIHPEVRVLDDSQGLVEYVASDETIDSYNEIIRASGWLFNDFQKNSPFVDSHDYSTVARLLGAVMDFRVTGNKLIETVRWAIDVDNPLAKLGFAMTRGGYLKAVSVGFEPVRWCTKWDSDKTVWKETLKELDVHEEDGVQAIYLAQEQKELSACIIGANPNALARAYKDGVLDGPGLDLLSEESSKRKLATAALESPAAAVARQGSAQRRFLERFERALNRL